MYVSKSERAFWLSCSVSQIILEVSGLTWVYSHSIYNFAMSSRNPGKS